MKKAIQIGVNVTSKKFGNGTITSIITASTGYVEINFSGNVRKVMLKHSDVEIEGVEIKKSESLNMTASEKKRAKNQREMAAYNALSPLEKYLQKIRSINGVIVGDTLSINYQLVTELLFKIESAAEENENKTVVAICDYVVRNFRVSDKQAYVVAKFAAENL